MVVSSALASSVNQAAVKLAAMTVTVGVLLLISLEQGLEISIKLQLASESGVEAAQSLAKADDAALVVTGAGVL